MRRSSDGALRFVSSNRHKYDEALPVLRGLGVRVEYERARLQEVQSDELAIIVRAKARDAYCRLGRPVIVEDDGLFVEALSGFPGAYSSHALRTIGVAGVLKLLGGNGDRRAKFSAAIAYDDGSEGRTFVASVRGMISEAPRGEKSWGYDPVFVPDGQDKTFAEMGPDQKIGTSHRTRALEAFAEWYVG